MYFHNSLISRGAYFLPEGETSQNAFQRSSSIIKNIHVKMGYPPLTQKTKISALNSKVYRPFI